jgi:hypothetical protein
MPAGVSTFTYVKFATAALLSMLAGSQTVHMYYRPLEDFEQLLKIVQENSERQKLVQQTVTESQQPPTDSSK